MPPALLIAPSTGQEQSVGRGVVHLFPNATKFTQVVANYIFIQQLESGRCMESGLFCTNGQAGNCSSIMGVISAQ